MNFTDNRLQFIHCEQLFENSQAAKDYVLKQSKLDRPALYAEPLILKYGDATNPNIILAIGSVGDGTASLDNSVFFIDTADIENSLKAIEDNEGVAQEDLVAVKTLVSNIIKACSLDENGNYQSDLNDALLKNADSLKSADKILSEALQNEIKRATEAEGILAKNNTIETVETDSVRLQIIKGDDGMKLKGMVKVATDYANENKLYPNSLIKTDNGLFVNIDLDYNERDAKLVFRDNGQPKEIQLPKETHIISGEYDYKSECLLLKLNRPLQDGVEDSDTISINLNKLIGEWTVLGKESETPIVLTKEPCQYSDELHGAEKYQDILKADVRIIDEIIPEIKDNILKRSEDGRALYVKGTADNIIYWKNGNKMTVKQALDESKCKLSQYDGNIIVEKIDGIYAKAEMSYNASTNTLSFNNGIDTKEFKLNNSGFIEDAYYDSATESLVIKFKLTDGSIDTVTVPLSQIFEEWDVNNVNHTVTLTKTQHQTQGKDLLSADVNIAQIDDNILKVNSHSLYVKGTADNIKYGSNSNVAAELEKLQGSAETDGSIRNLIKAETDARIAADEGLSTKINELSDKLDEEINRADETDAQLREDLDAEIARSTETDNKLRTDLDAEIVRSTNADNKLQSDLQAEITRSTDFDNQLRNDLDDEIERSTNADENLQNELDEEIQRSKDADTQLKNEIDTEVKRSTDFDNQLRSDLDDEIERAQEAETTLQGNLESEIKRSSDEDTKLKGELDAEVKRATEAEGELQDKLDAEITRSTNADTQLQNDLNAEIKRSTDFDNQLRSDLDAEVKRSSEADIQLNNDIESEVRRATAEETAIKDRITKVESDLSKAGDAISGNTIAITELKAKIDNHIQNSEKEHEELSSSIDTLTEKVNTNVQGITEVKNGLANEISRATAREDALEKLITDHTHDTDTMVERITKLEGDVNTLSSDLTKAGEAITNEITRATQAEAGLNTLATDAKNKAEKALQDIANETTRATQAEGAISSSLNAEIERAKGAETLLTTKIDAVEAKAQNNEANLAKETEERKAEDAKLKELIGQVAKEDSFVVQNSGTITMTKTSSESGSTLSAEVVVSKEDTNIINSDGNALKASVDLSYDGGRNVLVFKASNQPQKEIQLSAGSIIDGMSYDGDRHVIIIYYHTEASEDRQTVEVNVADLFNEINVAERGDKVISITLSEQSDGSKLISADVVLDSSSDNLLEKHGGVLFASKKADMHYANDGYTVQYHLDNLKSAIDKEISDREDAIDEINNRVDEISGTVANYEERFVRIETKNTEQDTLIKQLQDADTTINSTLNDHEQRIEKLEDYLGDGGIIEGIQDDIRNIKNDITNIEGDINSIEGDITEIQGDITTIEENINTIQGDVTNIKNDVSEISGNVTNIQENITEIQGDITDIQGDIETINENITNLGDEIEGLKQKTDIHPIETSTATLNYNSVDNNTTMSVDVKVSENADNLIAVKEDDEDGLFFDGSIDYGTY